MAICAKSSECRQSGLVCKGSRNIVRKNPLPDACTATRTFAIRGFKPGL
jgi:hypothetical protein